MSLVTIRPRSAVLVPYGRSGSATARTRVGAATDTAPSTSAMAGMGAAIPVLALGAVGAVFGGTLWGLYGLLGGALAGGGAGYAVTKLAGSNAAETVAAEDVGPVVHPRPKLPGDMPAVPADFDVPAAPKFVPPTVPTAFPEIVFPDAPTFFPTPSFWIPVSTVKSRERVDAHRGLSAGSVITFIAQRGFKGEKDTSDEIKLAARILNSRAAVTDRDPAYGVEVTGLVQEHNIDPTVERPFVGQQMVVAPDQVLALEVG